MDKKGASTANIVIVVVLIALLAGFGWFVYDNKKTASLSEVPIGEGTAIAVVDLNTCPDDGDTSLSIDLKNTINSTGSEGIDVTGYVYKKGDDGALQFVTTLTDFTSPTASLIDCDFDYVVKPVATTGAAGDMGHFDTVLAHDGDAKIVDGWLEFSTSTSTENIIVGVPQHASLNCRAYDNIARGLMSDGDAGGTGDYETDGVTFNSTVNGTKYDETSGVDVTFECKAVESDTEYNDRGILVLIEAPVATWAEPVVYVNGVKLAESTALLDNNERKDYTDYEYAFIIPADVSVKDGAEGMELRWKMSLADGVSSASADPEFDMAPRGAYLETAGVLVGTGAVTDASNPAQVHTLYDITLEVS